MVHGHAGSEFGSVCGYVSYNHENKRVENVFNQHACDFGVEEMKIVFCCCGC
jgi:hypothetical protein